MPEEAPFTAVLKFSAEEVIEGHIVSSTNCGSFPFHTVVHETHPEAAAVPQVPVLLQFKVPAQTSAIITNGEYFPGWQWWCVCMPKDTSFVVQTVSRYCCCNRRWCWHQPFTDSRECVPQARLGAQANPQGPCRRLQFKLSCAVSS